MIELSRDPENWGAGQDHGAGHPATGIDITDQAALGDFVAQVNRGGGIDVLAESLVTVVAAANRLLTEHRAKAPTPE